MSRALTQYLQSLKRAGVSRLPRATAPLLVEETVIETTRVVEQLTDVPPAAGAESIITATEGVGQAKSTRSRDERVAELAVLEERCARCTKCDALAVSRTQTVFGVGNPEAEIMFIGEAPGADEDRIGEPFVGKAGQLLDKIIAASKLSREEIYICNILRCRPPGNRDPLPEEAANCREFLDAQIGIVDPDYIVCWGRVAAQSLLGVTTSTGKLRQKWMRYGRAKVLCTYHPSYLLRSESAKRPVWDDMKMLRRDMGVEL